MSGFRKFLLRGDLVDLAVAVVIGTAFTFVVTALVRDLITPLIAAAGGAPDFGNLSFRSTERFRLRRFRRHAGDLRHHRGGGVLPGRGPSAGCWTC